MAYTRAEMNNLVNTNLGTQVGVVTAAEHRTVETAMLDYVSGQVLAGGTLYVGNGYKHDVVKRVSLGITLPNREYTPFGNIVSLRLDNDDAGWDRDNDMYWNIDYQGLDVFDVRFSEWQGFDQDVEWSWIIISTPQVIPPAQ